MVEKKLKKSCYLFSQKKNIQQKILQKYLPPPYELKSFRYKVTNVYVCTNIKDSIKKKLQKCTKNISLILN